MKNLVLMHYYLGLEVWKRSDEIFFSKAKYAVEILKNSGWTECPWPQP